MTAEAREVTIEALGAQGDGVAASPEGPLYVPFALPGESWRVTEGGANELLQASADRAAPVCRHFGTCGGCVAQHMPPGMYAAWKRGIVVQAFRHRGLDPPIAALVCAELASRRRVTLHARQDGKGLRLGFHRRASHDILDVEECPIATPRIVAALPMLRQMLGMAVSGRGESTVAVLDTPAGLDVHVTPADAGAARSHHARIGEAAARHGFARLTVGGDTLVLARAPQLALDGIAVEPPPGAFVQATEAAEREMIRLAVSATAKARRIADLFCGIGTFALPLARTARVLALDRDRDAIAALSAAARRAQGLKPIEARTRDLMREPLAAKELQGFDAVVLDPPRAGAAGQARELARSGVPTVLYVSCNPATLARDARTLVDGGYGIASVTPIDQFVFSAHVEAVALFTR